MTSERNRSYILFTFAAIYGWTLALPYEGPVLYALAEQKGISGINLNTVTVFCLFIGLFTGRYISTTLREAKRTVLLSIGGSLLLSLFMPLVPVGLWLYIVPGIGFLMGTVIAGFAHLITTYVPSEDRSLFGADMLIYSHVFLVIGHALSANATAMISFVGMSLILAMAFILILRIDLSKAPVPAVIDATDKILLRQFWIFFVFIFIISINLGLMFQVILPYFSAFEQLTSLYTHIPYILAIYLLARHIHGNKLNFLYIGLGLWGITFMAFSFTGPTEPGYLLVTTLMLSASGIFDYFWWSIMVGHFEHVDNPSSFFGLGLSFSVLGVWVGGTSGSRLLLSGFRPGQITLIGLVVVMISMIIILPLNHRLSEFLTDSEFMIRFTTNPNVHPDTYMDEVKGKLTAREFEVFTLLIQGHTDTIISETLNISLSTTKTHNRRIYRKLAASGRKQLIERVQQ